MTTPARSRDAGHRFPPGVSRHAIRLHFRFPLSLRRAEEMLAGRDIVVRHAPP
jgi:putative transposase